MASEDARARLEALKSDQQALKTQLAELDTYMQTKSIQPPQRTYATPAPAPTPRRRTHRPARDYGYTPPARGDQTQELLRMNLEESQKIVDKFDYLLDTLMDSMEEADSEHIDEMIHTIASTQSHIIDVLTNMKNVLDDTKSDAVTKESLKKLQEDEITRYSDITRKLTELSDKIEKPGYLQELDQMRVSLSNLNAELKRMRDKGSGAVSPEFKEQIKQLNVEVGSLDERLSEIYDSVQKVNTNVHTIQSTTVEMSQVKEQLEEMKNLLASKDDAILAETDRRAEKIEERIAELDAELKKVAALETMLTSIAGKLTPESADGLRSGLQSINTGAELKEKIEALSTAVTQLNSQVREMGEVKELLKQLKEEMHSRGHPEVGKKIGKLQEKDEITKTEIDQLKKELEKVGA